MTKILFTIFFTLSVFSLSAQKDYSNSIKVGHGGMCIKGWFPLYEPFAGNPKTFDNFMLGLIDSRRMQYQTIQFAYERRAYKNLFAGVAYAQWKAWGNDPGNPNYLIDKQGIIPSMTHGDVIARCNYKMVDAYAFYKLNILHHKHFFNIGVGASYTRGLNTCVDWVYISPDKLDGEIYTYSEKAHYWGAIPYFAYDFWFIKKRINIGPDFKARIYTGHLPIEYDINFHLGVNF